MTNFEAREFLPIYAAADPVRIYEPKRKPEAPKQGKPLRMHAEETARKFWKKYRISILAQHTGAGAKNSDSGSMCALNATQQSMTRLRNWISN